MPSARRIPEATVARLPALLPGAARDGRPATSAPSRRERLAELAGVNAAKVRKDLSYLGSYGTRGVGYDVDFLLHEISRELGLTHDWPVVIVGVGNLGHALANYRGFGARGFRSWRSSTPTRRRSAPGSATCHRPRSTTSPASWPSAGSRSGSSPPRRERRRRWPTASSTPA